MKYLYAYACALLMIGSPVVAQTIPDRPIHRSEIIAAAKRQFGSIDTNRDGIVTAEEFARFRASPAGQAAAATSDLFQHVGGHWLEHADTNGTGRVTPDMAAQHPLQLFDQLDLNHDGTLSLNELKLAQAMLSLSSR